MHLSALMKCSQVTSCSVMNYARSSVRLTFSYTTVLKGQHILLFLKFLRIGDATKHVKWLIGYKKLFPVHFSAFILRFLMLHLILLSFKICQDWKKRFLEKISMCQSLLNLCAFSQVDPWSVCQDSGRWRGLPPRENGPRNSKLGVVGRSRGGLRALG